MRLFVLNFAVFGIALAATVIVAPPAFGATLLNYQFESVDGTAPNQTTPDSTGNYVSSAVDPFVNAVLGFGTNTPGTDYPQLSTGPVANATVKSLNPNNFMSFYSAVETVPDRTHYTTVMISDAAALSLDVAFTNFSLALWLNPTSNSSTLDRFIMGKIGTNGNRGWQLYSPVGSTDLVLDYFETTANGTDRTFTLTGALPLNTWTHVAFAFDGTAGTEAMYINGVLASPVITGTLPTVPPVLNSANNQAFKVGHRGATSTTIGGWVGGIDDVRIYDQTLTAVEVQALMTPATAPHPGDFDNDGDVDGADFVAWQTNFPTASGATLAQGDADGDGDVDGADFVVWQTNFPFTPGPGAAAVPEPHAFLMLAIGGILAYVGRGKFIRAN